MKIREINVVKCQVGFACDVTFRVSTIKHFTDEEHTVRSHGRWMLGSVWNAMRDARREYKRLRAPRGARKLLGWR